MDSDSDTEVGNSDIPTSRTFQRIEEVHISAGLRDGLTAGKDAAFQSGFDKGFNEGFKIAYTLGQFNGVLQTIKCHHDTAKDAEGFLNSRQGLCQICAMEPSNLPSYDTQQITDIKDITTKQAEATKTALEEKIKDYQLLFKKCGVEDHLTKLKISI